MRDGEEERNQFWGKEKKRRDRERREKEEKEGKGRTAKNGVRDLK